MTTIAIMQPYFIPYPGYFRLFAKADVFVVLDDVQFTRRGRLHRNQLLNQNGKGEWLTLPLAKAPQDVKINQLEWHEGAQEMWDERLARFPLMEVEHPLLSKIRTLSDTPCGYNVALLQMITKQLGFDCTWQFSSALDVDPSLDAQARIIALIKQLGGTHYVNLPGGEELYTPRDFAKHGIALEFLPEYTEGYLSCAHYLVQDDPATLREAIIAPL